MMLRTSTTPDGPAFEGVDQVNSKNSYVFDVLAKTTSDSLTKVTSVTAPEPPSPLREAQLGVIQSISLGFVGEVDSESSETGPNVNRHKYLASTSKPLPLIDKRSNPNLFPDAGVAKSQLSKNPIVS